MAKDPAFPFYASDWLGSSMIAMMTAAEERGYLRLLCHQWASADQCLPADDGILSRLSLMGQEWFGSTNGQVVTQVTGQVSSQVNSESTSPFTYTILRQCFPPNPDKPGTVRNPRLYEIWQERQAWKDKCGKGGRKSAQNRAAKEAAQVKGQVNGQLTPQVKGNSPSPSPSPIDIEEPNGSSCPEPYGPASGPAPSPEEPPNHVGDGVGPDADPVVLEFPCKGTGPRVYQLRQSKIDEWSEAFPAVDVPATLRRALQWFRDNPTKLKTHRGIVRCLSGVWLGREQDRGGSRGSPPRPSHGEHHQARPLTDDEIDRINAGELTYEEILRQ